MLTFVVARYKEDVSWLNDLPRDARIYLYNKGPDIEPGVLSREVTLVNLPNAGRESATYMHHLMHRFDESEGEFTVFTQGDPFEHAPHLLDLVRVWQRWDDVQPLSLMWQAEKKIPPPHLLERERADWIDDLAIRREFFSLTSWAPVGFFDEGAWGIGGTYRQKHMLSNGTNVMAHFLEFAGLHQMAAEAETAELGVFSYGAIFGVRNRRVAEFIAKAGPQLATLELLTRADLNYGYIFERCWLHFFGLPFVHLAKPVTAVRAAPAKQGVNATELRNKAFAMMAQGRDDEARTMLQAALLMSPADSELMSDLAALALRRGDAADAITHARRALSSDPMNDAALFTLGVCQIATGDTAQALRSLGLLTSGPRGKKFATEQPELHQLAAQNLAGLQQGAAALTA